MATKFRSLLPGLILSVVLAACGKEEPAPAASSAPGAEAQKPSPGTYVPADDVAKNWGAFDFYGPHATLAGFQGHLSLEWVGTLPNAGDETLAGAAVYRIVNAQELHEQNANRDYRCLSPARWLAVKPGTPRTHVALLMMEDWKTFAPGKPGFCGSGAYEPG